MRYVMTKDYDLGGFSIEADVTNLELAEDFKVTGGEALGSMFPRLEFVLTTSQEPAGILGVGPFWLVSQAVRDFLQGFRIQIDYHDVDLVLTNGRPVAERYFLANVRVKVDCTDYARTKATLFEDMLDEIALLVVDEERCSGWDLFKLDNSSDDPIICSAELVAGYREAGFVGVQFVPVDQWRS